MNGRSAVPIDLKQWCGDLTLDIVVRMVVGKRCFNDGGGGGGGEGRRFQKAISEFFYLMGLFLVSDVIPLLKWFDFQGHRRAMKATAEELDSLLVKWLDEHRRKRSSSKGEVMEDSMDVMLSITGDGLMSGHDHDTIIKATCLSLILGGTDTTSVTLARAIALVLANPQVMEKAQEELNIHVGRGRSVDESDIKNLVYLQAIVKETFRHSPSAPIGVPRETMQDCKIDGYHVPVGTQLWSPGASTLSTFPLGPVAGRRACPGVSFALQVLHLALARVIHGFDLVIPSHGPINVTQSMSLNARNSEPIRVLFNPRLSPELYE
ncbi:hypothetical protein AAC387_Pa04g2215 [Persea americana]